MGGTYREENGMLYPNIIMDSDGEDNVRSVVDAGKYGLIWLDYLRDNKPSLYRHYMRTGKLLERAASVNEEAHAMLNRIMNEYLEKHKPADPGATMEMWRIREQAKMQAEEVVLHDIVYCDD
ncbi:MAG: TnpV protein [Lachnospiraceae bacterium]|nr:TnpV protein [Lachnospiraceae bacterium]